jgi:hypothetical protein
MVSPQPLEALHPTSSLATSSTKHSSHAAPLVAPSPTMQSSIAKSTITSHNNVPTPHHAHSKSIGASPPRMKRTTSFITTAHEHETQPYLWSLYDDLPPTASAHVMSGVEHNSPNSIASDLFSDMPPMQYTFGDDLSNYPTSVGDSYFASKMPILDAECEGCWEQGARCHQCTLGKQQQFNHNGWPIDQPSLYDDSAFAYVKQEPLYDDASWIKQEPCCYPQYSMPMHQDPPAQYDECEEKQGLPPLSAPLLVGDQLTRVQGKLTRFLPEGRDMMAVDTIDPNYTTAFEHEVANAPNMSEGRSRRVRKPIVRSRSPSPDLSERSSTPDSYGADSAYETDHYEQEDESHPPMHRDQHMLDDAISPPVVRYDDSGSSGQSSAEPPIPTRLLPVSAKDLLPSRPSTAAIPPAHIKDRLVKSAKKLLTAADGVNESVQVQVIPIWFPSKQASGAHKIRLIRVENTAEGSVSVYAHAADVGGVVERKSNISRLFGKFESPSEKLLMNVSADTCCDWCTTHAVRDPHMFRTDGLTLAIVSSAGHSTGRRRSQSYGRARVEYSDVEGREEVSRYE